MKGKQLTSTSHHARQCSEAVLLYDRLTYHPLLGAFEGQTLSNSEIPPAITNDSLESLTCHAFVFFLPPAARLVCLAILADTTSQMERDGKISSRITV